MSLGNISSFVLYSRKFSGPINEAANIISELQSALAAAERVFKLLSEETEAEDVPGAVQLENVRGNVGMRGVSFGYTKERTIIKNLYMEAGAGSMVAIVGPTGAGKTTIINLLMRFYDVDEGGIYVDGHEIRQLSRASLRRAFAMVLQDTWLFEGTVRENLVYNNEGVSDVKIMEACKAVGLHHFIRTLPHGYDTVLNDQVNLSQGQKQLLTIARAILADNRILILDEATSSVDTRTEARIQKAMNNLMKGRTSFVIAHRLSTIRDADLILVMKDGDIIEQGRHEQLLEKNGFYAELYNSQFEEATA